MAKSLKKNNKARKVSERAIAQKKELEEQAIAEEKARQAKEQRDKTQKELMKDAAISSVGGLLTLLSVLIGVYGLISIPAIFLCVKGYQANKDQGWRGKLIPVICIVINVVWIVCQILLLFWMDFRQAFYDFFTALLG